jgi:tetratricopeptide (TPR) repeat protein
MKPVRAADEDAPFSDSMLEWLEEGDRLAEAHPGGLRPSGAHHALETPRRRDRMFIAGGLVLAGALVLVLKLAGGKKVEAEDASPKTPVTVAAAPAAPASPEAPAPASAYQRVADRTEAPAAAAAAVRAPDPAAAVAAAPAAPEQPAGVPVQAPVAAAPAPAPVAAAPAVAAEPPAALAVAAAPAIPVAKAEVAPPAAVVAEPAEPKVALAATAAPSVAPAAVDYATALADCRASMTAGKIQRAVTSCRQATDAQPRSSEALTLLAEAEFTRGHAGVALKLATAATNANQNFADAYVIIGGVYQEKGKTAEARAAYEQYLALQPKGKHAADLRSILSGL